MKRMDAGACVRFMYGQLMILNYTYSAQRNEGPGLDYFLMRENNLKTTAWLWFFTKRNILERRLRLYRLLFSLGSRVRVRVADGWRAFVALILALCPASLTIAISWTLSVAFKPTEPTETTPIANLSLKYPSFHPSSVVSPHFWTKPCCQCFLQLY